MYGDKIHTTGGLVKDARSEKAPWPQYTAGTLGGVLKGRLHLEQRLQVRAGQGLERVLARDDGLGHILFLLLEL